ncbi:MAG: hypothetical protein ABI611_06705 [Solirubrobacteraceae bacterium]
MLAPARGAVHGFAGGGDDAGVRNFVLAHLVVERDLTIVELFGAHIAELVSGAKARSARLAPRSS